MTKNYTFEEVYEEIHYQRALGLNDYGRPVKIYDGSPNRPCGLPRTGTVEVTFIYYSDNQVGRWDAAFRCSRCGTGHIGSRQSWRKLELLSAQQQRCLSSHTQHNTSSHTKTAEIATWSVLPLQFSGLLWALLLLPGAARN
jgi:hypothetical protein